MSTTTDTTQAQNEFSIEQIWIQTGYSCDWWLVSQATVAKVINSCKVCKVVVKFVNINCKYRYLFVNCKYLQSCQNQNLFTSCKGGNLQFTKWL